MKPQGQLFECFREYYRRTDPLDLRHIYLLCQHRTQRDALTRTLLEFAGGEVQWLNDTYGTLEGLRVGTAVVTIAIMVQVQWKNVIEIYWGCDKGGQALFNDVAIALLMFGVWRESPGGQFVIGPEGLTFDSAMTTWEDVLVFDSPDGWC